MHSLYRVGDQENDNQRYDEDTSFHEYYEYDDDDFMDEYVPEEIRSYDSDNDLEPNLEDDGPEYNSDTGDEDDFGESSSGCNIQETYEDSIISDGFLSENKEEESNGTMQLSPLAFLIWRRILEKVTQAQHRTDFANWEQNRFLLPCAAEHLSNDLTNWNTLLEAPLRLSDNKLRQMFNLCTWNRNTARPSNIRSFFYIRSFRISVRDLRQIILSWTSEDIHFDEALEWWHSTKELPDMSELWIRYIGTTDSSTPYLRHRQDLSGHKSGLFGKFIQTLEQEFPNVLANIKIFDFADARIKELEASEALPRDAYVRGLRDFRERALIALFDQTTLLNQQTGGTTNDYEPSDQYKQLEMQVQTLISDLFWAVTTCGEELKSKIKTWAQKKQAFAVANQCITGSDMYPFSDSYTEALYQQALPYQFHSSEQVVLVNVGTAVTTREICSEKGFWDAGSNASNLLQCIIAGHGPNRSDLKQLFAWIDLWSWIRWSCTGRAISFFHEYMEITRPFITVCHDREIFSLLRSKFTDTTQFLSRESYLPRVGVLEVVQYGSDPQQCTIVLATLHPGYDRWGNRPPAFRRILHLTLWITLLMTKVATNVVSVANGTRMELCYKVKLATHRILDQLGITKLLKQEKESLYRNLNVTRYITRNLLETQTLHIRKHHLVDRVVACGVAKSPPGSIERLAEVDRLLDSNNVDLHLHIPRAKEVQWRNWATNEVLEGGLWFHRAIERAPRSIQKRILDPWIHNIYQENITCELIEENLSSILDKAMCQVKALMSRQQRSILRWHKNLEPQRRFNGTEVMITHTLKIYLPPTLEEKPIQIMIQGSVESLRPSNEKDQRFIFFTSAGIDIRNYEGRSFLAYGTVGAVRSTVTFELPHLMLLGLLVDSEQFFTEEETRARFISLWEEETGENYMRSLLHATFERKVSQDKQYRAEPLSAFGCSKYQPLIKGCFDSHTQQYQPREGDSVWLLGRFLDDWCPNGGSISCGRSDLWGTEPENVWKPLLEFLCQEEYDTYPGILKIRAFAVWEDSNMFRANLLLCRKILCTSSRRRKFKRNNETKMVVYEVSEKLC